MEAARSLDDKVCWERLGAAALTQGNHQVCIVEYVSLDLVVVSCTTVISNQVSICKSGYTNGKP